MIRYIILYCITSAICIIMCYLDLFVGNVNSTLQKVLIALFEFLSWIIVVRGAIKNMPKNPFSNKRVWYYCAAMAGILAATRTIVRLVDSLYII